MSQLDRARILHLLAELDAECFRVGITAEVFLVGGAAMALAYDAERSTRDLDGIFAPTAALRDAIASVGEREDLAPDWFNDAAKGFLPGNDPHSTIQYETKSLRVRVASPRYLLAMKLYSARFELDLEDAAHLARLEGITEEDELTQVLTEYYPVERILVKSRYFITEVARELSAAPEQSTAVGIPLHRDRSRHPAHPFGSGQGGPRAIADHRYTDGPSFGPGYTR